ncbi:DUF4136 domain-containing protein [Helicobacter sp. T3_23-1056]
MKNIAFVILFSIFFAGCFAILEPIQSQKYKDIEGYRFAYISQTATVDSGVGHSGYGTYGGYGYSVKKSINPRDAIAGILMKKGLVVVEKLTDETNALVVNYGQSGKRNVVGGIGGYTLEVSIQILDAKTQEPVYTCTAEGQGSTEADDIRVAITRCLSNL